MRLSSSLVLCRCRDVFAAPAISFFRVLAYYFKVLELVYENQTGDMLWSEDFFREVIDSACTHLNLDNKTVELGFYLVTPERSRELNKQHRQKDKPTDVLSFPLNERGLEKYGILPLGDIFICLKIAQQQADEVNVPLNQELARLVVHGLLHLIGYDHPDDEVSGPRLKRRGEKMIDLQEEILQTIFKHLNI